MAVKATPKVVAALRAADPVMERLVDEHGALVRKDLKNERPGDAYGALLRSIVGQQLSTKAAATIYGRMLELFDGHAPTPKQLLAVDPDRIRAAGLSRPKINYLRDLADHVEKGELELEHLDELSDEEVIEQLTAVKGIGEWSAHMFLMFHLGRPDILPVGDQGIRRAVQVQYRLRKMPGSEAPREDRPPVAPVPDAGVPLPLELARQQAGHVEPAGRSRDSRRGRSRARARMCPSRQGTPRTSGRGCEPARRRARSRRRWLRRHARDRECGDRHQAGAVAASHAVEEHAAGRRLLDRVEDLLDSIREALHERAVVERGPELRAVHPVDPELGVLVEPIERDVDGLHASGVLDQLVVVAQIDDRPNAMGAQRFPAGGTQAIDRVRAD